jgi:hypothetical protein
VYILVTLLHSVEGSRSLSLSLFTNPFRLLQRPWVDRLLGFLNSLMSKKSYAKL